MTANAPTPVILPGVYPDLTNAQHHADPAIGASGLKAIARSPLHYWARYIDPDREPDEPTPAMKLGTATHCAVLEPARFAEEYVEVPEGLDRRTKEGKALWAELQASGREPISARDASYVRSMTAAARAHPVSRILFGLAPRFERSIFWRDAATGVVCKIRPDLFVEPCAMFPNGLIVDLKTTEDASPDGFPAQAWRLDMHLQGAFYADGFCAALGTPVPPAFLWLAVEKDAPHATAYYSLGGDLLAHGRREYRRHLDTYARCLRDNIWPGYSTAVADLQPPGWALKAIEDAARGAA